ncbi:TPA: hypothetical protein N0F65_009083 [Lagenidium giganteum]|uniref:Retroviral polymerase SH3-like domain-containing protein n=1 Tax=Lagenidium giganteum TaxID=4803 RepID=A0AAV2YNY0_9STRA|nr:TPA: hypothetical protein N0F65_009083 [Lagenidium giganteum]
MRRDKLDPRARLCIYLGIPDIRKAIASDATPTKIVHSRDVDFDETRFPTVDLQPAITSRRSAITPGPTVTSGPKEAIPPPQGDDTDTSVIHNTFIGQPSPSDHQRQSKRKRSNDADLDTCNNEEPTLSLDDQHDLQTQQLIYSLVAIRYISKPRTHNVDMASDEAPHWQQADVSEFQSPMENETWTLVPPAD